MIEAKHITYRIPNGPYILDDFSFSIGKGERVALIGPSGYGKSTLAKILAGWERPLQGEILLQGAPIRAKGYYPIQLIYQHPEQALNPLWKTEKSLKEAWPVDDALLESFGVEKEWLDRWPNELSGGQLQRISLVRALSPETKLVIADEITTSLDAITQAQIWHVLLDYLNKYDMALLLITHNISLANRLCNRTLSIVHERRS